MVSKYHTHDTAQEGMRIYCGMAASPIGGLDQGSPTRAHQGHNQQRSDPPDMPKTISHIHKDHTHNPLATPMTIGHTHKDHTHGSSQ